MSLKFPDGFLLGAGTAAYQIEGGYDKRGETSFDYYINLNPSMIADGCDAKIACDSYHRYEDDLDILADLGVDFYRFSIAWTRILPTGYSNVINEDGIRYYNNLIDGLVARKIKPVVTIYHYDLPKPLQDIGAFSNPHLADLFEDYSKILFKNFGDRVKTWITFNIGFWGYGDNEYPPKINQSGIVEYMALKTYLLAHAKTYHMYQKEFREEQQGQIGITIDGKHYKPASDSPQDHEAAELAREFTTGIVAEPFFGSGDFPEKVKERVAKMSAKEGYLRSRLPEITPEEKSFFKGSCDFLGLNIYTAFLTEMDPELENQKTCSFEKDMGVKAYFDPKWEGCVAEWLKVTPWGLRVSLNWVKNKYNNPPVWITENGFPDAGELEDLDRIRYYQLYIRALLEAINEDGVQVKGYAAWSLLDNFEWLQGYSHRFGLYHVDFTDPDRKRTPKASSKWYKKLIASRQLDAPSS